MIDVMLTAPTYQNLLSLEIRNAQIASIEKLQFINLSKIHKIDVANNHLITLKSLSKLYLNNLR
jgi:hypothetical protein